MNKKYKNGPINDKLSKLSCEGRIPFHMPGHKRKADRKNITAFDGAKCIDITEITDYDNLHQPTGIIRESMDLLKGIYHTKESWYLVGGSTAGILSAISAAASPGDKILVGRNCHKSVYNAIRLLRLSAVYLYPSCSDDYGLSLDLGTGEREEIKKILAKEKNIRAVVITSPTYEGVVTDISAVRKVISDYDDRIPLIVDEAHGAHMIFHDAFPASAVECGADIVVQSLHKTLPALTQTALLHLCTDRVSGRTLFDWLSVYETSSPSYVLMASAEASVLYMTYQKKEVERYVDRLYALRRKCKDFSFLHLIEKEDLSVFAYDMSKLVFAVKGKEGVGSWLFARLREGWNLELEMAGRDYVLAMTSVMDEEQDYMRLWEALHVLDEELAEKHGNDIDDPDTMVPYKKNCPAIKLLEPWECKNVQMVSLPLAKSQGRIAATYVMVYPPGVPLLVPGEKIVKEMVEKLTFYVYNGYNVQGLSDGRIPVLDLNRD